MAKIRAAIIGFAHTHVNEIAPYLCGQPDSELVAAADAKSGIEVLPPLRFTAEWNKQNVVANYCSKYYENYVQMLEEEKPDIVYILTENWQKPQVVEECAKRKINVCIEKPIAVNYEEALKIQASVEKYGIEAVVNWPVMWRPYIHKMKAAIDRGLIGEPKKLRYINGHTGPFGQGIFQRGVSGTDEKASYHLMTDEQRGKTWWHNKKNGGGVFLDLCGYGCFFAEWLLGDDAKGVSSCGAQLNTPFGDVEDNFAAIIKYDDRMAVVEGTWSTPRAVIPSGPMLIGTEGVIMCTGGAENEPGVAAYDMFGNKLAIPDIEFEDKYKNMPWMWADHIRSGKAVENMVNFKTNMHIMKMMDAMICASESGKTEKI